AQAHGRTNFASTPQAPEPGEWAWAGLRASRQVVAAPGFHSELPTAQHSVRARFLPFGLPARPLVAHRFRRPNRALCAPSAIPPMRAPTETQRVGRTKRLRLRGRSLPGAFRPNAG